MRGHENTLGVAGGKRRTGGGRTGLEEERGALGGGVYDVPGVEVEVFTVVVDGADLVRVRVAVVGGIGRYGVVCPGGFPEPTTRTNYKPFVYTSGSIEAGTFLLIEDL